MKTSFISLSNQEAHDFVQANPKLERLVAEAAFLNGNLNEDSQVKENERTGLGVFHSALKLNHELSLTNEREALENVLKLMHNSALRIAEFFEALIQTHPDKETDHYDEGSDFVIKKDVFQDVVYYSIRQSNNKTITTKILLDPNEDSDSMESYGIEYSDQAENYKTVHKSPTKERREKDESLEFISQHNIDHYRLISQKAHSYELTHGSTSSADRITANVSAEMDAQTASQEDIPLNKLDLDLETPYIKALYEALKEKL